MKSPPRVDLRDVDTGKSVSRKAKLEAMRKPAKRVTDALSAEQRRLVKPLDPASLSPEALDRLAGVQKALPDSDVLPVAKGLVERLEGQGEYHDQESEWENGDEDSVIAEESEMRQFNRDFTGDGLAGKTDVTEDQSVMLTQFRILEGDYDRDFPELGLPRFPHWFERYRLSINRKSRTEMVEINRGQIAPKPTEFQEKPPSRL